MKNAPTVVEPDLQLRRMEWILRVQQRKSTPFTEKTPPQTRWSLPILFSSHGIGYGAILRSPTATLSRQRLTIGQNRVQPQHQLLSVG